jgi:hypothetical protein
MSRSLELIPNSFQVPNFLVDKLLPHLSGPQAKILMVLCRKTFGWHKREDVISFSQFRDEAGVSRSSAFEALRVFVDAGLVLKASKGRVDMNAWSLNLDADADKVLERLMTEAKPSADVDKSLAPEADLSNRRTSTAGGLVQPAHQKWSNRRTRGGPTGGPTETKETQKTQSPLPPPAKAEGDDAVDVEVKEIWNFFAGSPLSDELPGIECTAIRYDSALLKVWDYYREKLKRASHYELTRQRRVMGEAGLKACEKWARMNGSTNPAEDAIELMKHAINRLAESPWHNGQNERGVKYLDWEVLFRSRNTPSPQKLTDYWLNDEKWGAA